MKKKHYGDIHELKLNNNINANILLTGVTGFLGSHYAFWRTQFEGKLYVLVRAENQDAAWQRVINALEISAQSYNLPLPDEEILKDKIICITSELTEPACGISKQDIEMLKQAQITEVWHCAASLSFLERHRERIFQTNVDGTEYLLDVVKECNINHFVYISTAYTAGQMSGDIPEEIHDDSVVFSNCYEESKAAAEKVIVKYCEENAMDWRILRPSIVIGPHVAQCSGGTRFGIYGFAQEMFQLRHTLRNVKAPLRLVGDEDCKMSLIPVDQVVYDMLYLSHIEFGEHQVYHLSNSFNTLLKDYFKIVEKIMKTNCLQLVSKRNIKATSLEKLFDEKTAFYAGYYKTQKYFDRRLPEHKPVTHAELTNYMRHYKQELMDEEQGSIFNREYVHSWDGEKLCVHSIGDKQLPPLILANAYGMPVDFLIPLAKRLMNNFHVITWDSRWVPSLTHEFDKEQCDSLTHAKDLISILDHYDIADCPIVGWSSGVQVCLRTMAEFGKRISCAILLNGGISLKLDEGCGITEYEENIRSLLPKISKNKRMAQLYCDLIYGSNHQLKADDENAIGTILTSTDPHLLYMTSMPFRTPEALYRYANMMSLMFAESDDAHTSTIDTPVLVYGGMKDKITHPDVARQLAQQLKNGSLHISDDSDHFAQFYEQAVANMIIDYSQQYSQKKVV